MIKSCILGKKPRIFAFGDCRLFAQISKRFRQVEVSVDDKTVLIEEGSVVIQACEKAGVHIPRYCYHEKLGIAGNCRMCLVEVNKGPKPVPSCALPVMDKQIIYTNTPMVLQARENVMEMMLANHPLDCPVCDQGGECDLQEQSMRYGRDKGRFLEMSGKRAVEDKNIGPLIKTVMTRCIHCTRCIRFANEVAGAPELGSTGRGNDMQIGTYLEKNLKSELSGNVIDLCPVGALTSKPYAFRARPWDLKRTETIDTNDAMGCAIKVDSKGLEVLRVLPRFNDDINEQWIDDKARFACDGQSVQRLTTPLVKINGRFKTVSWSQALQFIADRFTQINPQGNELKAIVGHLVDSEAIVVLKDLLNWFGSSNHTLDLNLGIFHADFRSKYLFNSTIVGVEEADKILLIGTNPRYEAAVLNARIRKNWLHHDNTEIALLGEKSEQIYEYKYLGKSPKSLEEALNGEYGKKLVQAKKPLIIIGSGILESKEADAILYLVNSFAHKHEKNFFNNDWNGVNVLHRSASAAAALDLGFTIVDPAILDVKPKVIWLLGADEIKPREISKDAFVIYQGHHGDVGAKIADIILPGCTPYEKTAVYVNLEGRAQLSRAATSPPGVARDDWRIVKAVAEILGFHLPYYTVIEVRKRLAEVSPTFLHFDSISRTNFAALSAKILSDTCKKATISNSLLKNPIKDFYMTNSIARNSKTMSRCSNEFYK